MDTTTATSMRARVAALHDLERHVRQSLDAQVAMDARSAEVVEAIRFFRDTVSGSTSRIANHLVSEFEGAESTVKGAVVDALGSAAGALDRIRTTTVARSIRDDYVAFSSVIVGYQMLLTSALATGDVATARVAEMALRDYTSCLQRCNEVLTQATLDDLQANPDVTVVNNGVAGAVQAAVDRSWADASP